MLEQCTIEGRGKLRILSQSIQDGRCRDQQYFCSPGSRNCVCRKRDVLQSGNHAQRVARAEESNEHAFTINGTALYGNQSFPDHNERLSCVTSTPHVVACP